MESEKLNTAILNDRVNWLLNRLDESLKGAELRRRQNRWWASCIRIAAIVSSGGATLLLGLQIADHEAILNNGALFLVVLVTMLNAFEPYFNFRALWVEHELAIARFHRINKFTIG